MTSELSAAAAEIEMKELVTADAINTTGNGPRGVWPVAAEIPNTAGASAVTPMSDDELNSEAARIWLADEDYTEIVSLAKRYAASQRGEV